MIKTVADIGGACDGGRCHTQPFIKTWASSYNTANGWYDATMSGNYPRASYYNGDDLTFTEYPSGNHLSFFHGGNVSPYQKVLRKICLHGSSANLTPSRYILCDILGFYTGVSWETTDEQVMNNSVTLPRYTDGSGVRAFAVQLFGNNANSVYTINYTNSVGIDVTSPIQTGNALGAGSLQHGQTAANYNPFIDLCSGCKGVRKINSITVTSLGTGIAVLVLVKPIAELTLRDSSLQAPTEIDFLTDKLTAPVIYDGAKLNFIFTPTASPAGLLTRGYLEFIWS